MFKQKIVTMTEFITHANLHKSMKLIVDITNGDVDYDVRKLVDIVEELRSMSPLGKKNKK